MYTFRDGPPKIEQLTYMYNDAVAPFLHVMLMTMLELAAGNLLGVTSIDDALSLTARRFFDSKSLATPPSRGTKGSSPRIPVPKPKTCGPDLWSTLEGIAPGISDDALLDSLMYLPDDILLKIQNFMNLDDQDEEDADFIELYGGLFTLARASTVIEDHGLLHNVGKPKASVSSSASDEAYISDGPDTDKALSDTEPTTSLPTTSTSATQTTSETVHQGSQSDLAVANVEVQAGVAPLLKHQSTQALEPPVKRRRISIEIWTENGEIKAQIPPDSLPAGPDSIAEGHGSEPATDCGQEEPAPLAVDVALPPESPVSSTRQCHELPPGDRLKLLDGRLDDVAVPHMTEIPSRFGSSPDFGPRCAQCGHKQDPSKPLRLHPIDACPVVGKYGTEAYNPVTGFWTAPPCLYPLCPRNGHHFTKLCPELQSLCLRCGRRGHSTSRCDLATLEYSKEALGNIYEVFKSFGLRSRKSAHCPDWDFRPEIPELRVVTLLNKHYLFPWTEAEAERVSNLSQPEIKAQILQELYK